MFKVMKTNFIHQIDNKPKHFSQLCECSEKENLSIAKSFKYDYRADWLVAWWWSVGGRVGGLVVRG